MLIMNQYQVFADVAALAIGLEYPVKMRLHKGIPKAKGADALYWPRNGYHAVAIDMNAARGCILANIAHELVHAYCEENHQKAKDHGATFQRLCGKLRRNLRKCGYYVGPLYIKGLDK